MLTLSWRDERSTMTPVRGLRVARGHARVRDRDQDYTWFFRAEFQAVVRTAYLVLHDRQRAEDIAQDAFTQLLIHWGKVSRFDRPDAWVRRVAIRAAVRHLRRERMRDALERQTETEPVIERARDVDLMGAIATLPPQQRAAIALFYLEDRPTQEVADIIGCSTSTAKVHLFKARKTLAQMLGEEMLDVS